MALPESIVAGLLGGAVAAAIGGILNERAERIRHAAALSLELGRQREERRKDDLRFRRDRLIEPIITFTDDLLASISETYWTNTEIALGALGAPPEGFQERLINLRNREACVEARVLALGDPALARAFQALSMQLSNLQRAQKAEGFGAAREEAKKASKLGGDVLAAACRVEGLGSSAPT